MEYSNCRLCPRECGVNRLSGEIGFCGETAELRIAAMLAHFGEEPCITGKRGSGTVFFSGCGCGCFFCQNFQISHQHIGKIYSQDDLLNGLRGLVAQGVHNLNFVTPDHYWPHIKATCLALRDEGVDIPFLWNSSGYANVELVPEQCRLFDVFLPDFKFALPELAEKCMGDSRYPEIALKALSEMVDRKGFLRPWDPSGEITATRGVLVRHLVLPGQLDNSIRTLDLLIEHFGPNLPLSIMSQFQPMPECDRLGIFNSKISVEDYAKVCEHAVSLGFTRLFAQEGLGDDSFAPDFTSDKPFGNKNSPKR